MSSKTIGIEEEVYERLAPRKRPDESFTELLDRLMDDTTPDWREGFGSISEEAADEALAAVGDAREDRRERQANRREQHEELLREVTGDDEAA